MKKTILLSSILAVGAAFADATVNSTEVGVMGVDKPTSEATLIAVPFEGYGEPSIAVKDMINTPQLEAGTAIYVPNASGTYDVWTLGSNGKWTNTENNVVIGNGDATEDAGPDAAAVTTTRGSAFWLKPPSTGAATGICYLLGKPASAAGESALVADKWNLIGNTSGDEKGKSISTGLEGEKVCVPNAAGGLTTYTYRNKVGGWALEGKREAETVTIEPGQGFWYLSKGTPKIAW